MNGPFDTLVTTYKKCTIKDRRSRKSTIDGDVCQKDVSSIECLSSNINFCGLMKMKACIFESKTPLQNITYNSDYITTMCIRVDFSKVKIHL